MSRADASAPPYASAEVADHHVRSHLPCRGISVTAQYDCECGDSTLHVCGACGRFLLLETHADEWCDCSKAMYEACGGKL